MGSSSWKRNLVALWVAQTLTMAAFSFVFPFFPLYVQFLGVADPVQAAQWAGAIIAATAVSMSVAQPIWGSISDRKGRRPMVVRSMVGGAITLGLMGMVTSVEQLLVLRFIQGAVTGTVAAANALAASSVPRSRLGFTLGFMQVALFLGTSVGPLLGGVLADTWGFRVPFYAATVLMLLGAVTVVLFVHEDFTPPAEEPGRPGPLAEARALLRLPLLPLLASIVFMIQLGGVVVSPVLTLFIADLSSGQNAATSAGLVLAATGAVSAVAALALGRVGDRVGHGRILTVCLAGAAIAYFPQSLVQNVWQLLLLRMLLGVFLGGLMPSANALLANLVPRERRGSVFGLSAAATSMSNAVGPLSGAAIATHLGIRAIFVATGFLYVLSFGWVFFGLRRPTPPAAPRVDATPVATERLSLEQEPEPADVSVGATTRDPRV